MAVFSLLEKHAIVPRLSSDARGFGVSGLAITSPQRALGPAFLRPLSWIFHGRFWRPVRNRTETGSQSAPRGICDARSARQGNLDGNLPLRQAPRLFRI